MSSRRPDADGTCWVDGREVPVAQATLRVDDPALQGGVGLFETLASIDGGVLDLEAHLERLRTGSARLSVTLPDSGTIEATVLEAASRCPSPGWLKILVTGGGRWFVFTGAIDPDEQGRPASAVLLRWRRNRRDALGGLKALSYAGNLIGAAEARRLGADEGLWLNDRGHLTEGCTSNLFVVSGRRLLTPAVQDGILPGVVRAIVLRAARSFGMPVHEGKLRVPRLQRAGEAFLTSSVRGIRPLVRLDGRPVGAGEPGPWTRRIADEVEKRRLAGLKRAAEAGLTVDPRPTNLA